MSLHEKTVSPLQSLQEQRLQLRRKIAEQREVIAFQLTPSYKLPHAESGMSVVHPRSLTMRLLRQNPAPILKLAIGAASWLFGPRASKMLNEGMQFLKMVRTGATLR